MKNVLLAVALGLSTTLAFADAAKKDEKPPVTAQKKPEVKKPCKDGQDPEKDNCHKLNKVEKKK